MKLSLIIPSSHLYDFDEFQDFLIILSSLCNNDTYKKYILSNNKPKILNYIFDKTIDYSILYDLVEELNIETIIVPNIIENSNETLKLADEFYNMFIKKFTNKKTKTIIVPQGSNFSEYCVCLYKMNVFPYDFIGVNYFQSGLSYNECEDLRLKKIQAITNYQPNKLIYLLGLARLSYIPEYKKYLNVQYLITSFPITLAFANQKLNILSENKNKSKNFFDLRLNDEQFKLARQNVIIFKKYIETGNI